MEYEQGLDNELQAIRD